MPALAHEVCPVSPVTDWPRGWSATHRSFSVFSLTRGRSCQGANSDTRRCRSPQVSD